MDSTIHRYPRPEILERLPPSGHVVIEASAGTGKTYTLEHLVLELLIGGASLEEILVVTFTEKATREMRSRVRDTLAKLLFDPPCEVEPEGSYWELDAATRGRLLDAFISFDRAPISTIHGFCQRVLADHAFQSQRPFTQELIEPRRAFRRALREELRCQLAQPGPARDMLLAQLDDLGPERFEDALFPWFVERGAHRPTWNEERFGQAIDALPAPDDPIVEATIRRAIPRRDLAARIVGQLQKLLRIAAKHRGQGKALDALVAVDRWASTKVVGDDQARLWLPDRLRGEALAPLRAQIVALLDVAPATFGVMAQTFLPKLRERLNAEKQARAQMDFDDMLRLVDEALRGPGGEELCRSLQRNYRHALVDEFQDTDEIQWRIFRTLFPDHTSGQRRLFVIGDPKQAIYSFRNADIHTYQRARLELTQGAPPVRLEDNYRSTIRVIEGYNRIFDSNEEGGFFQGSIRYDDPVRCGRPDIQALTPAGKDAPALCLWQFIAPDKKPKIDAFRQNFARRIAEEAKRLVEEKSLLFDEKLSDGEGNALPPRALSYSDIHVLTRSASEAQVIAEALHEANVPYAFFKQDGLFQTEEAADLLSLLRAVANPQDRSAQLRAWLTPYFAVPLSRLEACRDLDAQHPLVAQLFHLQELAEGDDDAALLRAISEETGLVRRLLLRRDGERQLTNIRHLLEILLEESGGRRGIAELVARLEAFVEGRAEPLSGEGSVQRRATEHSAVQLLTMHKSKGLEAPVVFLGGGFGRGGRQGKLRPLISHNKGRREAWLAPMPSDVKARTEQEEQEEDERLLYVALTRAKARLYLPYFGTTPASHHKEAAGGHAYGPLLGPYRLLDRRLEALVLRGFVDDDSVSLEIVPMKRRSSAVVPPSLPVEDFVPPAPLALDEEAYADRRKGQAGFILTSYTRLKAGQNDALAISEGGAHDEFFGEEEVPEEPELADTEDELPGGASMGVFLHEVIEDLDFPELALATDAERWLASDSVHRLIAKVARRNGIAEDHWGNAGRLIHQALRCPQSIAPGHTDLPAGFAGLTAFVAEMDFHFPIPEPNHPPLEAPELPAELRAFRIGRGVLRGVVDLVFEHGGRTYFLDWKSDRVSSGQPALLRQHVDAHYALQAKLYTLGVVRLLGLRSEEDYEARFGGLLYAFLRQMKDANRGVVFDRPSWSEVQGWEEQLRTSNAPFGYDLRLPK